MTDPFSDPVFYALLAMSVFGAVLLVTLKPRKPRGEDEYEAPPPPRYQERNTHQPHRLTPPVPAGKSSYEDWFRLLIWADEAQCYSCGRIVNLRNGNSVARRLVYMGDGVWVEYIHTLCGKPIWGVRPWELEKRITADVLSSQYRREDVKTGVAGVGVAQEPVAQSTPPQQPPPVSLEQAPPQQPQQPTALIPGDKYMRLKSMPREQLEKFLWSCSSCPHFREDSGCTVPDKSGRNYRVWGSTAACSWWLKERVIRLLSTGVLEVAEP
ncbi:MAG: hypothetical protein QW580_02045 [Nitrososphaerota archaeon]